ncbi:unnamed protein product [Effrenium voratum]|uniref:E3 ubiquitin-protein ligase n=2 Tax=Effrenium voratum TaxID=2562239 RepID=A0AA36ID50_9DINO|nr:unnamed protein product [Effrenium voratum]
MGWQNLSTSLRLWDTGSKAVSEVEAAAEELLASDDAALQLFAEALDPSLQRGTDFLKRLAETEGAKCRCDAVWYGDTIAYGCKTCGLSSASCICVFCFDAGDHEGHDFYISRSDYGCCDCGDAYAWRQSGFCRHHPGPREEVDPAQLLPEATRRRAQLLIPAQVRRLVKFHPSVLPGVAPPPVPCGDRRASAGSLQGGSSESGAGDGETLSSASQVETEGPHHVLISGINLRVTEEVLREFIEGKLSPVEASLQSLELQRDQETKASKGRAYATLSTEVGMLALVDASGEVLRGSPLRVHVGEDMAVAEKHLQALETNFEWLLSLGGFHDGLRKIIGQVFLDKKVIGHGQNAVEVLLRHSHLMEPSARKLETNLMVDLMLDLNFKYRFGQVFTDLYQELVRNREGNQETNELGDFTCQIFTRQDVTLELVQDKNLLKTLLDCLWDLLRPTLLKEVPPVFNHESNVFRDHEIIQCSMDLLYVLDHAKVAREIICTPLRGQLWSGWVRILISMQAMNPHKRRQGTHVEFTTPNWGNALTLHTDLMSNTWLILEAVESKADLEAVTDMAQLAWRELRAWMVQVHVAEGRVGAAAMESIDYEVSKGTSFHVPVNRVLALLIHQLCIRPSEDLEKAFSAVGMAASDVLWWMEHPLRCLVLHSQVMSGMWRRNGEALEHECEFYRMNYWHHLLMDVDLLVLRMSALVLRPEEFFSATLKRFELGAWLQPGDPLRCLFGEHMEEFAMQKLQSFTLFLYQLLSSNTHLSLTWSQLVTHTTRQFLAVGPKSHSQLWDPRLERSTATATTTDQQTLEAALREISHFSEADGSGHTSAKYNLREDQWLGVDPYFHLFSWSDQQKVEENLSHALKARGWDLAHWVEQSARQPMQEAYQQRFQRWCSSGMVQAFCWLLLVRLAFQPKKDHCERLLVLGLLLALRSLRASTEEHAASSATGPGSHWDGQAQAELSDEAQLLWLSKAMGRNLAESAVRKFRIQVAAESTLEVSLMDAVERLATMKESMCGSLACALRSQLGTAKEASQAGSACAGMDVSSGHDHEDHRAKRRKAAQERQQRLLDNLRKRQAEFISGAGQRYEHVPIHSPQTATEVEMQVSPAECVVCMSQEGEDDPLGLICFLRPAVASSLPRRRVPVEQAVLLQAPRGPGAFRSRPQCFEPTAPDGLVLARACSHRMHFSCWWRFRATSLSGGRLSCPYCGTAANALLPVGGAQGPGLEESPAPRRHGEASDDFVACLEGQLGRLQDSHLQPPALAQALGLGAAPSHPFMGLSKLCADNIALAEVRARTRSAAEAAAHLAARCPSSSSSSAKRPLDGTVASAAHALVLQGMVEEALDAAPPSQTTILSLAFNEASAGELAPCLLSATPHSRFQILTALLCACRARGGWHAARRLVHSFYLLEAIMVLTALADLSLVESELQGSGGFWHWVHELSIQGASSGLTPIQTLEEAAKVLRLALNPFLYKVRLLLHLLAREEFQTGESLFTSTSLEVLPPAEDHSRLATAEYGLPEVDELLMPQPQSLDLAALTQLLGRTPSSGEPLRGHRPASPLLLVLVGDEPPAEAPSHVWQVSPAGFERLHASGCQEFVELTPHFPLRGCRLFCVAYRLSLPVITGSVYQKFYTQFVHARCTVCKTSSSIPTLCLLCGKFLCCNSECCRQEGDGGQIGEVTQHAQVCGFGTCVFLQLSNSLVHIVTDGFITCWGSLYLDGHGEEEYTLSRPLHISEVRLQQLTQLVREVAFDFESRLKWKKVIFV